MHRTVAIAAAVVLVMSAAHPAAAQARDATPVVFVHGMGGNAAEMGTTQFRDLLRGVAERHPTGDVCQRDAQGGRPWGDASPCVFRYVEDMAETDDGPNDSQSAVTDNADKLAREIAEVSRNAGGSRVVLVGYSMGGAIIRTYLADHNADAERLVEAVVLVDAVASGSWGYAFASEVPRRFDGELSNRVDELLRSVALSSASVNFDRPASSDLTPRSPLFRRIVRTAPPSGAAYYTFWGDIRVVIERSLLHYELPRFTIPIGDLGLLPGVPDPAGLPELGGQRFKPPGGIEVAHRGRITLSAQIIRDLIRACGHKDGDDERCAALVSDHIVIANSHNAIGVAMDEIEVEDSPLGSDLTLLDAILVAIGRHA